MKEFLIKNRQKKEKIITEEYVMNLQDSMQKQ